MSEVLHQLNLKGTDLLRRFQQGTSDRLDGARRVLQAAQDYAAESRAGIHVSQDPFKQVADRLGKIKL